MSAPGSVRTPGCVVNCTESGEGQPLVFIHGLGGSVAVWDDVAALMSSGQRAIRLDLRASGATEELQPEPLTLDRWAEDLRELLDALGVERPVLIGHSLGASVALKAAQRWPELPLALVLLGADPNLSRASRWFAENIPRMESDGLERWLDEVWIRDLPFSAESVAADPTLVPRYREILGRNAGDEYVRTCHAIATSEDLTETLATIDVPALVISGEHDTRTPARSGRRLAELLPRGSFEELPGVGHIPQLEAPEAVATAIAGFVAGLRSG